MKNPEQEDGHLLRSGMLARVVLAVGPPQTALLVPKDALVLGGPTPRVFVVQTRGASAGQEATVQPVDVQLGVSTGNLVQLKGQVREGQLVVVQGNERLRDGQAVRLLTTGAE